MASQPTADCQFQSHLYFDWETSRLGRHWLRVRVAHEDGSPGQFSFAARSPEGFALQFRNTVPQDGIPTALAAGVDLEFGMDVDLVALFGIGSAEPKLDLILSFSIYPGPPDQGHVPMAPPKCLRLKPREQAQTIELEVRLA